MERTTVHDLEETSKILKRQQSTMGPSMKTSIGCVWFLLFSQSLAWDWPFLSARTPVAEPIPNIIYGACPENGALVCNGPTLFGTCNYGSIVYHSVAEGTVCKDGKIIHKKGANELCPRDGLLVCHGSRMYGYCKSGKVDYQPVTEGVWCQDGRLFGTARQPPPPLPPPQYQPSVVVPYSVLPYSSSIPQDRMHYNITSRCYSSGEQVFGYSIRRQSARPIFTTSEARQLEHTDRRYGLQAGMYPAVHV